jgi:hypothetical protein
MGEERESGKSSGSAADTQPAPGESVWPDLLKTAGNHLIPVLLTAGSLIGFVAFAGGVIVWTRFSAAKVPPDQAVNAVPRDELVAIGSSLLLLFGFFGALALVGAFLIDRGARATPGMARGLLVLFLVESVTAITIADELSVTRTIATAELIALPVGAALWATFVDSYVHMKDDLVTRKTESPGPRRYGMFLFSGAISGDDYHRLTTPLVQATQCVCRPLARVKPLAWLGRALARLWRNAAALGHRIARSCAPTDLSDRGATNGHPLAGQAPILVAAFGIVVGTALVAFDASDVSLLVWLSASLGLLVAFAAWRTLGEAPGIRQRLVGKRRSMGGEERKKGEKHEEELKSKLTHDEYRLLKERQETSRKRRQESRLLHERPLRLKLKGGGALLIVALLAAAVALPWCWLGLWWVGVSIATAAGLSIALWRIATFSTQRLAWYGVAVFLSVPLFGTLVTMAHNVADPQVQPMALIRNTDGPDEAIQGLYVTEADDRVYFASVATEGCDNRLKPHSGRLQWVPKSEVVAMSIGPLQDIKRAGSSALEMAYALTPAVETPAGDEASLTAGERQAAEVEEEPAGPKLDKRLEDAGPAVRPFYGAGLSLEPEDASPGEKVTLKMSKPNRSDGVRGFGAIREARTVRVGGVRADILKEPARRVESAEYLETVGGTVLKLEKDEPFVRTGPREYAPASQEPGAKGRKFLKLIDPKVRAVSDHGVIEGGYFLELVTRGRKRVPELENEQQSVELKGHVDETGSRGKPMSEFLEPRPRGQAWHEKEIRFEIPENASTGAVTVECSQLAGQPLLRVSHVPEARMSVRMQAGSDRVTFDSSHTTDGDEEKISRRWNVAGLRRGNLPEMSADLPPRPGVYTVSLTATDESGSTDTAELYLLRLPASLLEKGGDHRSIRRARGRLRRFVGNELPAAIEIDGNADDPGTPGYNAQLSLWRAEYARQRLLRKRATVPQNLLQAEASAVQGPFKAEVPVRMLGFGEGCPVDPRHGRHLRNRRVDVFVLNKGVSMDPPSGCHPRRLKSTKWELSSSDSCPGKQSRTQAPQGSLWGRLIGLVRQVSGGAIKKVIWHIFGNATTAPASGRGCQS